MFDLAPGRVLGTTLGSRNPDFLVLDLDLSIGCCLIATENNSNGLDFKRSVSRGAQISKILTFSAGESYKSFCKFF